MSADAKTVLEWTYEPDALFEEPCTLSCLGGEISISEGKVRGEFDGSYYDQGREFRDRVHAYVYAQFMAQQVQMQRDFHLSKASMARECPNGRRDVTAFPQPLIMTAVVGRADITIRDSDGNVVQDTKVERRNKQREFRNDVARLLPNDLILRRMLQSYRTALSDKENMLIHLHEVREALVTECGGDSTNAKSLLDVSSSDWSRFGRLANNEPVREGRHRGRHVELRPAPKSEIEWALEFSKELIEKYVRLKVQE